jgi:hypothetical protein
MKKGLAAGKYDAVKHAVNILNDGSDGCQREFSLHGEIAIAVPASIHAFTGYLNFKKTRVHG